MSSLTGVEFFLAGISDFKQCHVMMRASDLTKDCELGVPTVVAKRDGKVLGFMSTAPLYKAQAVVCHRILVSPDLPRIAQGLLLFRLVEYYEVVLLQAGMRWYHANVDKTNNHFNDLIERAFGCEPYATDKYDNWYKRELVGA